MIVDSLKRVARAVLAPLGIRPHRFPLRGVFATYEEAMASVRRGALAGYNHDAIVPICYEAMCNVTLWDYPVLFWLQQLAPEINCLVDAGGHMGTKYRAFRGHLRRFDHVRWVVYDVPAMIRAGRERAQAEGLSSLSFVESLSEAPPADLMLASGLLQYLDIPFPDLLGKLPRQPRHLLLNKVATRDGPTVVTLERLGPSETPYQIRSRTQFEDSLRALGYVIVDEWVIPELSHVIRGHSSLGASTSRGYYARLVRADSGAIEPQGLAPGKLEHVP
jgi:putative methyltransferase (TIGR04325 family)